jgi:hypothetical protein
LRNCLKLRGLVLSKRRLYRQQKHAEAQNCCDLADVDIHIISPYSFGGIVREAAQHVKSNQGGSEFRGTG